MAPTTTIAPAKTITVTSPETGTKLVRGQKHTVRWQSTGLKGNVYLRVIKIDDNGSYGTANKYTFASTGEYLWTTESNLPPGLYKINVFSPKEENGLGYDISAFSNPFSIIGITISSSLKNIGTITDEQKVANIYAGIVALAEKIKEARSS